MFDYSNSSKVFIIPILIIILCPILWGLLNSCESSKYQDEMMKYDMLIVDGIEYQIDDIQNISWEYKYQASDIITITLKDGTIIHFQEGQYILKNNK